MQKGLYLVLFNSVNLLINVEIINNLKETTYSTKNKQIKKEVG